MAQQQKDYEDVPLESITGQPAGGAAPVSGDPGIVAGFIAAAKRTNPLDILKSIHAQDSPVGLGAARELGRQVHLIPGVSSSIDWLYGVPGLSAQAFGEPLSPQEEQGAGMAHALEFA